MKIAFLGAGKMASALAGGIVAKHIVDVDQIVAADLYESARVNFSQSTGIRTVEDNAEAVDFASVVFITVKPQVAEKVLTALPPEAYAHRLIISVAAGLTIENLSKWTGSDRIVRVMPNTPALIGRGASGFAAAPGATSGDKENTRRLLAAVGVVHEVREDELDAVTGVSGSGPAYVFEFIAAMIEAAKAQGLSDDIAEDLVLETVSGAAEMARSRIDTPENLRIAVTSPGGTTAAGLNVFKEADIRGLVDNVVKAAVARSVELGR
jgi:pyrroline-5-carboxylate reductase